MKLDLTKYEAQNTPFAHYVELVEKLFADDTPKARQTLKLALSVGGFDIPPVVLAGKPLAIMSAVYQLHPKLSYHEVALTPDVIIRLFSKVKLEGEHIFWTGQLNSQNRVQLGLTLPNGKYMVLPVAKLLYSLKHEAQDILTPKDRLFKTCGHHSCVSPSCHFIIKSKTRNKAKS